MTGKPSVSIQQITNKITNFKQDICEMLDSDLERPIGSWVKDRETLKGLVDTAKGVAQRYINGAMKTTLMILIDNSLYTIDDINEKIKTLKRTNNLEKEEDAKEPKAEVLHSGGTAHDEPIIVKKNINAQPIPIVKNYSNNQIQVQRIFKRSKKGHSYKTFLYLEYNEEIHQLTNNDLKRKNYRGDINGFQKFLTDKGYMVGVVPIVDMPDMIRK